MLFSAKSKGFFVEQNDHTVLLARTSAPVAPLVVEALNECPVGDAAALTEALRQLQPKKSTSGFLNAVCGVYPAQRLVRRATLDLKRVKEAGYLAELLTTQFRIEPDQYTVHAINAPDGTDLNLAKVTQKEVLFCGMTSSDVVATQDGLLASGIYPDRLELGSIATLGAVADYLAFKKSKTPTLVLELGNTVTHSFIVTASGVEASRPVPQGLSSMLPVVQKELGLKDEESARKLFFSNTFDFTGMSPLLIRNLLRELQSAIGFYEVQTGQSVGQVLCTQLPPRLGWLDAGIAAALGIASLKLDLMPWLASRQVTVPEGIAPGELDGRWFGLFSLMTRYTSSDAPAAETKE